MEKISRERENMVREMQDVVKENAVLRDKIAGLDRDWLEMLKRISDFEKEIRNEKDLNWDLLKKIENTESEIEEKIEGIVEKNQDELEKISA